VSGKLDLTVGACIVADKKILLMHHAKLDKWLFPGGHIEQNETPDDAILREVREETGLEAQFKQYGEVNISPDVKKLAIPFYANVHSVGNHNHFCSYYFMSVDNVNLTKNNESKDLKWFTYDEIKQSNELLQNIKDTAMYILMFDAVSRL